MTTTATAPACPKCGGAMWDQKNGKYPWKPGTPIFKCRDKECAKDGGVYWEDRGPAIQKTAAPKPALKTENYPPHVLLPNEQEETAELQAKIGVDTSDLEKKLSVYQSIAEWGVRTLPPIFEGGKNPVGITPETVAACINTIFINAVGKK